MIEGISARRVRDNSKVSLAAKVVDPWQRRVRLGYHILALFVVKVSELHSCAPEKLGLAENSGILQNDFDVDLSKIHFVTFGDGHVPEYRDPPNCERTTSGKSLLNMLLDGDVDAAVLSGEDLKHPKLKPLIPDPSAAGKAWHAKYNALMVNHIVVVKSELSKTNPDAVREVYRMLKASHGASTEAAPKDGIDKRPIGYSANKRNFEVAAQYASRGGILVKELKLDDLFDDTTRALD